MTVEVLLFAMRPKKFYFIYFPHYSLQDLLKQAISTLCFWWGIIIALFVERLYFVWEKFQLFAPISP